MKPKFRFIRHNGFALIALAFPVLSQSLHAAPITWSNTGTNFNANASWVGGTVPGAADIATFTNAKVTSPVLSADASIQGLKFSNTAASGYTLSASTLTLGSSGIDASAVTSGTNTISSALTLAAGGQAWTVGTGSTLAINPTLPTRNTGATVKLDTTVGTGTVSTNILANTNDILGPWAMVHSPGVSTNNTVDGDTYATVSGGSIVPYTGATPETGTGAWGGIPSGGTGKINYDTNGTMAVTGLQRDVNTIRYTGTGASQPSNINPVANVLTINGFMNAGSGEFFIGGTGGANQYGVNVTVGASLDLVLSPMTAGITLRNAILNNAAGASAVTVSGAQTVTLTGASSYTGPTTVAAGTLLVSGTGAINTSSGLTINGVDAKYLHTGTVTSTVPVTLTRGTLDGTGTLGAVTISDNASAILTNGNGGKASLTLGSLTFNGKATVNVNRSASAPLVVTGALATTPANGKITINAAAPLWNIGANNIISSGGFSGAATDFQLGTITGLSPRQTASGVVVSGADVAVMVTGDTPVWSGAANGNWTTTVIANPKNWKLQLGGTRTDFLTGDLCVFDDSATGTTNVDIFNDNVSPASVTFNNSAKNYTLGSNAGYGIATGTLTKSGTGSLTIAETVFSINDGGTTFNGGTLVLNSNAAIGTGPVTINPGNPKTLDNTSAAEVVLFSGVQNWNDDFTFSGTNDLDTGSGAVALGGSGTNRTVTVNANTLKVGEIKSSTLGLVKMGAGTLRVNSVGNGVAASQIAGSLNVAAGSLQINSTGTDAGQSGDFTATGLSGTGTIVNGAAVERWLFVNTVGNETFNGLLANGGDGGLGFNKQGIGSVTFNHANTYTGATTIEGGTLVAANPAALGTTSLIRFLTGTTLSIATDGGDNLWPIAFASGVTANIVSDRATPGAGINHTLTTQSLANGLGGGTINVTSGANVTSGIGRITFKLLGLGAGSVQTTTLNPTTANVTLGDVSKQNNNVSQILGLGGTSSDNQVTGVISPGPALIAPNMISVLKTGASTWTLSNTNTYAGGTTLGTGGLAAGTLRATANGALGTGTIIFDTFGNASDALLKLAGDITLANNVSLASRNVITPAIVNESGNNTLGGIITIGAGGTQARLQSDVGTLTISGSITTGAITARNLYLQGDANGTASGVISDNAVDVNGKVNLTKEGNGSWTISAANTYTGTTTVNGGILAVNGNSIADTGTVIINGGKVGLTGIETVNALFFGGVQQPAGSYTTAGDGTHFSGAGTLKVLTGAAGGYATWAASKGFSNQPGQDSDNDGVSNGVEYFFNSNFGFTASPALAGGVITWPNGGNLPASAYGSQFVVQTSPDLSTWTPVPVGSLTTNTNSTLSYTVPNGAGKLFVRLVVIPN